MIVKCIRSSLPREDSDIGPHDWQLDLILGKEYRVIEIEADDYRVMDESGIPCLSPAEAFEVVDPTPEEDWVKEVGEDGEMYWGPQELSEPGLWEAYFDGVESAVEKIRSYLGRHT